MHYHIFFTRVEAHACIHSRICSIALMVAAYVRGSDEETREMRRSIVRYCVLSQALVFRDISMRVRRRFPNLDAIVAAGNAMSFDYWVSPKCWLLYAPGA